MVDRPSEKYALIHDLVTTADEEFTLSYLCNVAGVSRSGYDRWLSTAPRRLQREATDYEQRVVIREIFLKRNRKAGWRVIRMNLERQNIIMNPKKIRRLMKKYGLITQIRRRNERHRICWNGNLTKQFRTVPLAPISPT